MQEVLRRTRGRLQYTTTTVPLPASKPAITLTKDTRRTLSTITDSTSDPAILLSSNDKRNAMNEELLGRWDYDPQLLEEAYLEPEPSKVEDLLAYAQKSLWSKRWKKIPHCPRNEEEVGEAFIKLVEKLQEFGETPPRGTFVDTHRKQIWTRGGEDYLQPDIFVRGRGDLYPTLPESDTPEWSQCRAVGDIKVLNRSRSPLKAGGKKRKRPERSPEKGLGKGKVKNRDQLATYVQQVFMAQENRRFVPAFLLDEMDLEFFIFDRYGAVCGRVIDYHAEPLPFCALIHALSTLPDSEVGIDPSIFYADGLQYILTTRVADSTESNSSAASQSPPKLDRVRYVVERTLFHSARIVGNGAVYWIAYEHGNENACFIIADTWAPNGFEELRQLSDLTKGMVEGVASCVHIQNVDINGRLDSVSCNRPNSCGAELVHTRVVLAVSAQAKVLEHFSDIDELVWAIQDVVLGLRNLHRSGVLHGSIAPYHILIQADEGEGKRGVLFDLSSSLNTQTNSKVKLTSTNNGHSVFRSWNSLDKKPLSYLDDLESLYYVLCHIVMCCSVDKSIPLQPATHPVSTWFSPLGGRADKIAAFLPSVGQISMGPSFERLNELLQSLHHFFHGRMLEFAGSRWKPSMEDDYRSILKYIESATRATGTFVTPSNEDAEATTNADQMSIMEEKAFDRTHSIDWTDQPASQGGQPLEG